MPTSSRVLGGSRHPEKTDSEPRKKKGRREGGRESKEKEGREEEVELAREDLESCVRFRPFLSFLSSFFS